MIPVSIEDEIHYILTLRMPNLEGEELILLDSCFKNCKATDPWVADIEYFTKLLELFAGMCSGKNFLNSSSISMWYTGKSLMFNIWNKNLSPALRASFGKLFTALYIDCYAQVETKRLETVRIILQDSVKRKSTRKFLRLESNLNSLEAIRMASEGSVSIKAEEQVLHEIKDDIIQYYQEFMGKKFNKLSLELLNISYKLLKLEIIGLGVYDPDTKENINLVSHSGFNQVETGVYRLLTVVNKVLFSFYDDKKFTLATVTMREKPKKDPVTNQSQKNEGEACTLGKIPLQKSLGSKQINDYFNILMTNETDSTSYSGDEIECKIKLLEIMDFVLDWRQDRLVTNVIEGFKKHIDKKSNFSTVELFKLLPPIIEVKHYENEQNLLVNFDRFIIPDLAWMGKDLIEKLLKLFMITNNYIMQNLILRIVRRCFNQRAKLLKSLNGLSVIYSAEEANLFNWLKINMAIFTEISEQSEIWITFFKPGTNYEKNFKKFKRILKILRHLNVILLEKTIIEDEKPFILEKCSTASASRQSLIVHLNFHSKIIALIRDSMHNLDEIYDDPQISALIFGKEKLVELFSLAFQVLIKIVMQNKTNQKIFHRYVDVFTRNLRMDLGQTGLLIEIFRDNDEICSEISEDFLQIFLSLVENEGRQARFIELFPVIQVVDGKPLQNIQRLVFKAIAQNPNYKYYLYLDEESKFDYATQSQSININYEDQPTVYHRKVIETITSCSVGTKNIYLTEVKCQNLFSINMIFNSLNAAELKHSHSISLRIPLLKLFYHAYVESEKFLETLFRNSDFVEYVKKHTGAQETSQEFIEIMIKIVSKYSENYINKERYIYEIFDDYEAIKNFLNQLDKSKITAKFISENPSFLNELQTIYNFEVEIEDASLNEISFLEQETTNRVIAEWDSFKKQILYEPEMKSQVKSENKALLNIIINIEKYIEKITFEEFLSKLLKYMKHAHTKNPPVSILVNCINFIISILSSMENQKKEEIQNNLCDLNIVKIILSIMCDKNTNKKVYNRLVNLSVEILDGGNSKAQSEFYAYFTNSNNSEEFFFKNYNYLNSKKKIINAAKLPVYKTQKDNILKILRLMQLLCENHYSALQNYLRYQEKSNNSYNIIEPIVNLFKKLLAEKQFDSFLILSQCLDTLTEFIQGPCEGNQKALLALKFLEISNDFLCIDQKDPLLSKYSSLNIEQKSEEISVPLLKGWMVVHLKYKISITLLSLLEINSDDYIISLMARSFSKNVFQENLNSIYLAFIETNNTEEYKEEIFKHYKDNDSFKFEDRKHPQDDRENYYLSVIELGFNLYHLERYLNDHNCKVKNIVPDDYISQAPSGILSSQFLSDILNLFSSMYMQGKNLLKKIWKKKNFNPLELTALSNRFFETHTGRIEIALEDSRIIYIYFTLQPLSLYLTPEIEFDFHESVDRTSSQSKLQYLQIKSSEMLIEIKNEERLEIFFKKYPLVSFFTSNVRLWYSVGFILTLLLNIMLISSYHEPYDYQNFIPTFCLKSNNSGICEETMTETKTAELFQAIGGFHLGCAVLVLIFQVLKAGPKLYKGYKEKYYKESSHKFLRFLQKAFSILRTICNLKVSYYLTYTVVSFAAITSHAYLLYSIHLLDVLYRFPSLQNVVKSVYKSRNTLAITYMFIIVLIYYFSLWGFARLQLDYNGQCPNIYICMLKTYDRGLKLGMGFVLNDWTDGTFNNERVFFDNLYNLAILVMMMNFIKGIIFDSFFVLNDETDQKTWDREHVCFICGLEQELVEKETGRSFWYHTEKEHNEWNYAFYIMYLNSKPETELTSIESYVQGCLKEKEISWFPLNSCTTTNEVAEEAENDTEKSLNLLKQQLAAIRKDFAEIKQAKNSH